MFAKKMTINVISCLTVLTAAVPSANAIDNQLAIYAGAAVFNNPDFDSVALVEFPFSINRNQLSFYMPDSVDGGLYARVFAQVDMFDLSGQPIDSAKTLFSVKVSSHEEARTKDIRIFNKLLLMAKPGLYSARVTVIDAVSKLEGSYFFDKITVEPNEAGRLNIGGAYLAYEMKYVGEEDARYNPRLHRNGFQMVVNPVSIFAESDTIVYLYSEVYNLSYSPSSPSEYQFTLTALDGAGIPFKLLSSKTREKPGPSCVLAEKLDIKGWRTGNYSLQMIVSDPDVSVSDTAMVPLSIISPNAVLLEASSRQIIESIDPYDSLTLDDQIHLVKYLLTPDENRVLSNLSDSGKVNFLNQYWREHDVNPATSVIENRLEMVRRLQYSNRLFSTDDLKSDGWSTDRGRIYLAYGPWDERDDFQAPRLGNPYVIWHYRSVKEGKLFVFEDWSGNGDYRLVHSNVYGEVYSKDWQTKIDQGFIDVYE